MKTRTFSFALCLIAFSMSALAEAPGELCARAIEACTQNAFAACDIARTHLRSRNIDCPGASVRADPSRPIEGNVAPGLPTPRSSVSTYARPSASQLRPETSRGSNYNEPVNDNGEKCLDIDVTSQREGANGIVYSARVLNSCKFAIEVRYVWVGSKFTSPGLTTVRPFGSTPISQCYASWGCNGTVRAGASTAD